MSKPDQRRMYLTDIFDTTTMWRDAQRRMLAESGKCPEAFAKFLGPLALDADKNHIPYSVFGERVGAHLGVTNYDEQIVEGLRPNQPMHDIIGVFRRAGWVTGAFTNVGAGFFELAEGHPHAPIPGEDLLDFVIKSCDIGLAKPEDASYAYVEAVAWAQYGVTPDAIVFSDDNHDNVARALERGWQAHIPDPVNPAATAAMLSERYLTA